MFRKSFERRNSQGTNLQKKVLKKLITQVSAELHESYQKLQNSLIKQTLKTRKKIDFLCSLMNTTVREQSA